MGLSNQSFVLGTVVVRIGDGPFRSGEIRDLRAAARAGIGPGVVAADPAAGLLVTRRLAGRALGLADFRSFDRVADAARLLARLHREEPFSRPHPHAPVRAPADAVPLHGDPCPSNWILTSDGLRLVDFEHAGQGNRYWDLAEFAAESELDEEREAALFAAYGLPYEPKRLRAWKAHADAIGVAWADGRASRAHAMGDDRRLEMYRSYAERRRARISDRSGPTVRPPPSRSTWTGSTS